MDISLIDHNNCPNTIKCPKNDLGIHNGKLVNELIAVRSDPCPASFEAIPKELLSNIFKNLSLKDLTHAAHLSKASYQEAKRLYYKINEDKKIDAIFSLVKERALISLQTIDQMGESLAAMVDKPCGNTLLHQAVLHDQVDIINFLLKLKKIDVNAKNSLDDTPLYLAAKKGLCSIAKRLIMHSEININTENGKFGRSALHIAILEEHLKLAEQLISSPACDVNKQDNNGESGLYHAIRKNNLQVVELLLNQPIIDVNQQNGKCCTALMLAVLKGNTDIVKVLLEHASIDINIDDCKRRSHNALNFAIWKNRFDIAKLLAARKDINANSITLMGWTTMSLSIKSRNIQIIEILEMLPQKGAKADIDGRTPSYYLVREGDEYGIKVMLDDSDTSLESALLEIHIKRAHLMGNVPVFNLDLF
ncbi:ankyrin repeat domain-containing F-box protein [Acerihabitans sp. KWT182]|uniref:Ankyrin repeat domain-containing F-box protein n=1 Tax=Acerihabitans sp. KWT182 TaxID=3157919 RepID=A0AAU7Q9C1_9GAMM